MPYHLTEISGAREPQAIPPDLDAFLAWVDRQSDSLLAGLTVREAVELYFQSLQPIPPRDPETSLLLRKASNSLIRHLWKIGNVRPER
jgi:hypothetical protein